MRHQHRMSLLLFNDIWKVLAFQLYPGSVNGYRLAEFMYEKMYNVIQSYPNDHSVVELDNHSIHYDPRVHEFLLNKGAIFFPCVAYDPRRNPTEYLFGNIKAKLPGKTRNVITQQDMIQPIIDSVLELQDGISRSVMKMAKLEWMLSLPD